MRAAVNVVITADSLGQRAAGPGTGGSLTACCFPGAPCGFVTFGIIAALYWIFANQGHGHAPCRTITRGGFQITHSAMWTAVQVVLTAHSLSKGTTGPVTSEGFAAGVPVRTGHGTIAGNSFHFSLYVCRLLHNSWKFNSHGRVHIRGNAHFMSHVTLSSCRTTVNVVVAAHSIRHGAAAIVTRGHLAAGRFIRTKCGMIWTLNVIWG